MLIVESTLLTWSALFDLFFAFEYIYKTQEVVFLVFLYLLIKMLFAIGDDLNYGLNTLGPLCLWQCFFSQTWGSQTGGRWGGDLGNIPTFFFVNVHNRGIALYSK